jgi:hypothetical protein
MRAAFGVAFLMITALTLCPIQYRPTTGHVLSERFVAFGLLGALSVFAFPRRLRRNIIMLATIALALEAGQKLSSSRHGRVLDVAEKVAGGVSGIIAASLILRGRRAARVLQASAAGASTREAADEPAREPTGGRA